MLPVSNASFDLIHSNLAAPSFPLGCAAGGAIFNPYLQPRFSVTQVADGFGENVIPGAFADVSDGYDTDEAGQCLPNKYAYCKPGVGSIRYSGPTSIIGRSVWLNEEADVGLYGDPLTFGSGVFPEIPLACGTISATNSYDLENIDLRDFGDVDEEGDSCFEAST